MHCLWLASAVWPIAGAATSLDPCLSQVLPELRGAQFPSPQLSVVLQEIVSLICPLWRSVPAGLADGRVKPVFMTA